MLSSIKSGTAYLRSSAGGLVRLRSPSRPLRLGFGTAVLWAVVAALGMSTQYLFQPFVWRNWPVADVVAGWLDIASDRVVVALTIALAITVATRLELRRPWSRAAVLAIAIALGATVGEFALLATGLSDAWANWHEAAGRAIQWCGLAVCVAGIHYLWLREGGDRATVRANELSRSNAETLLVQTRLQVLRQQIDPHFLFNTLATIRRFQEIGHDDGHRLLRHLLSYLRLAAAASMQATTLGDEVDLVESYLAIAAVRMSGRLTVRIDVPANLRGFSCPPLALATLVENAVKHGITPVPAGGEIDVRARRDGEFLEIAVIDTGAGIPAANRANAGGAGIGLANTRARLRALHGRAATVSVTGNSPRGVCAVVRLPLGSVSS